MELNSNTIGNILKEKGLKLSFTFNDRNKNKNLQIWKSKDKTNEVINKYRNESVKK